MNLFYSFLWRLLLHRLILWPVGIVLLIPITLYATARKLDQLPILNSIFGCEEDGWNGNGTDPNNPRQGWQEGVYHKFVEDKDKKDGVNYQGWWYDYLQINYSELSFIKRWWLGYKWCALRNTCWNLRLSDWFGVRIHYNSIDPYIAVDLETEKYYADWKTGFYYERPLLGRLLEFGFEFYPYVFNLSDPLYDRIRKVGYTREYKYKTVSIPSIKLKKGVSYASRKKKAKT